MEQTGVKFGTSGARGLATDMTDKVCYAYTLGFLQYLESIGERGSGTTEVAVAGDLRPSTNRIMEAVARAVESKGLQPLWCGRIPSPAVAFYGIQHAVPAVMVTGSHIPDDRNGIKFNKCGGEILKTDEAGIREQEINLEEHLFNSDGSFQNPIFAKRKQDRVALDNYVKRYTGFFPSDSLKGMNIGVYQHSAVGRDILVEILESLGARVTPLGRSDRFIPVDTEAIRPEDVELARNWAAESAYDAIASTDGDSDRPLLSDETGNWLRGDVAGILCAQFLEADSVSTPVSCNTAVEKCGFFQEVRRTRIGSPFVIESMYQAAREGRQRIVGYEANGGFLTNSDFKRDGKTLAPLPTRDAVILILSILLLSKHSGKPVSQLSAELPSRYTASDRLKEFPREKSQSILQRFSTGNDATDRQAIEKVFGSDFGPVKQIDRTDGLRITFDSGEIVHLRPSGNAPEFRCYTEAGSNQRALQLNQRCMQILQALTG